LASPGAQQTVQVHPGGRSTSEPRGRSTAPISIEYGRPFPKADGRQSRTVRKWRTGADEATTIVSDKPLRFGALTMPAGTYTLYTLPGENEWQLIVSKKTGQWGIPYPAGQDLGRVPMKVEKAAAPAEQLTLSLEDTPAGGILRVTWGTTSASVAFVVG
jgi:hypothetical protein